MRSLLLTAAVLLALGPVARSAFAREVEVRDDAGLREALAALAPGDVVRIAPGTYRGGHHLRGVRGTPARRIVIAGADVEHPPVFRGGGGTAFQLSDCDHVTLVDLVVRGFAANGINLDDGGTFETPATGLRVERVRIEDTGPRGNHDALKLSGLVDFRVEDCTFEGWGGSAIDMVGCRRGVVDHCRFRGKAGFSQASGVQMKGGTEDVLVHRSEFVDAGERAVNLGGSTGLAYFRPAVTRFEAARIEVAGNRFRGGATPVAFVTADAGSFHHNTITLPERWVLRILQETNDERFGACRGGRFERNLVIFDDRVSSFVNVGPGTDAESFVFRENAWFDARGDRRPRLPVAETGGVYLPGLDAAPLTDVGAAAYAPRPAPR